MQTWEKMVNGWDFLFFFNEIPHLMEDYKKKSSFMESLKDGLIEE